MELAELIRYMARRRDHAKTHGSAVCESFDLSELEMIVAALEAMRNAMSEEDRERTR
jgi:hypothetical protein